MGKHATNRLRRIGACIRGIPGSGKSTMAKGMSSTHKHFEADMFFEKDGNYEYVPALVNDAHIWCADQVRNAFIRNENVVIANTFSRFFEMEKYLREAAEFGCDIKLIEATGRWQNVHGIPDIAIAKMKSRWEKITIEMIQSRLRQLDQTGVASNSPSAP